MNQVQSPSRSFRANVRRTTVKLFYWTLAWVLSLAFATFGPRFIWDDAVVVTAAVIALNLLIGVGMIVANKNHLLSLDEMQRNIQLQSLALTLGVGLVAGLAYSTLDITNVVSFDAEISHLVLLMGLTNIVALVALTRKYR